MNIKMEKINVEKLSAHIKFNRMDMKLNSGFFKFKFAMINIED